MKIGHNIIPSHHHRSVVHILFANKNFRKREKKVNKLYKWVRFTADASIVRRAYTHRHALSFWCVFVFKNKNKWIWRDGTNLNQRTHFFFHRRGAKTSSVLNYIAYTLLLILFLFSAQKMRWVFHKHWPVKCDVCSAFTTDCTIVNRSTCTGKAN